MLCFCSCVLCALTGTTWTTAWGPMCLWGSKLRPSPVPAYTSLPGLCRWEETVFQPKVFFFFVHCHWPSVQLMLVLRRLMPSFPRYLCPPSLIGTCCLVSLKMRLKRSASPPWSFTPGRRYFFWKVENLPAPVRFNIVKRESLTPTVHSTLLWTVMTVV